MGRMGNKHRLRVSIAILIVALPGSFVSKCVAVENYALLVAVGDDDLKELRPLKFMWAIFRAEIREEPHLECVTKFDRCDGARALRYSDAYDSVHVGFELMECQL